MDKQFLATIMVVGLIGFVLGAFFGDRLFFRQNRTELQAQLDEVKSFFPVVNDSKVLSGSVKSVESNLIILDTPTNNPFDNSPKTRELVITPDTKIVVNRNKTPEVMQKELSDYQKTISDWDTNSDGSLPLQPTPFEEIILSINDIRLGDKITVESDTNIYMSQRFNVFKIIVQSSEDPLPNLPTP